MDEPIRPDPSPVERCERRHPETGARCWLPPGHGGRCLVLRVVDGTIPPNNDWQRLFDARPDVTTDDLAQAIIREIVWGPYVDCPRETG